MNKQVDVSAAKATMKSTQAGRGVQRARRASWRTALGTLALQWLFERSPEDTECVCHEGPTVCQVAGQVTESALPRVTWVMRGNVLFRLHAGPFLCPSDHVMLCSRGAIPYVAK